MLTLAAPGDTWGISGPAFLAVYAGAAVFLLVVALVIRLRVTRVDAASSGRQPTPAEVAYLNGGPSTALYSSLAGLRAVGAVAVGPAGALTTSGPMPAALSRLDHAVYEAAGRRAQVSRLEQDSHVAAALRDLRESLVRAGWLFDDDQRARVRTGAWPILALAGFGVVRVLAGIGNDRPVGYLVMLTGAVLIVGIVLLRVHGRSAAGARLVNEARRAHTHLAPSQAPSWATYGLAGAAMGVALYGTAALWAADPSFAAAADIRRTSSDSGSSGGGDSGGGFEGAGGCGGGGGGGGGCGGGGCGGGGCGG